jgi:hypothetical protein
MKNEKERVIHGRRSELDDGDVIVGSLGVVEAMRVYR